MNLEIRFDDKNLLSFRIAHHTITNVINKSVFENFMMYPKN